MIDSTVNLSFRYEELDYVRALRAHYASRLHLRLDVGAAVAVGGYGLYLWSASPQRWLGVACVVIAVVFILMLVLGLTVVPRLMFRREAKFRDEYSLSFSAAGIHFRTTHIDSRLGWGMYSRALIDGHSYVLYYGSRQFSVIPKRVFQSAEQQRAFEQLLTHHVSAIDRRT